MLVVFISATSYAQNAQEGMVKVSGKVLDDKSKEPVKARIVYEKLPYGDDMGLYNTNKENGDYTFYLLPTRKYLVQVKAEGYFPYSEEIAVNDQAAEGAGEIINKNFILTSSTSGSLIRMHNLVFQQGKADILEESHTEINTLVTMMIRNPNMKVQLEGHTDFRGRASLNMELSQRRVEAVKKYLLNKGIKKNRVAIKAFGGTQPITREDNEEAHKLNRRVEVRILQK